MKFIQVNRFGLDGLSVEQCDVPRPGDRQVLVRVRANSLNYRDLRVVMGAYDPRMTLPRIPFSDGAGDVIEIGTGVTRFKAGDRVAAIFMQTWLSGSINETHSRSALGGPIDGMLAEYVVLHEDGLVEIPAHLCYEEAAALPCAAVTAWNALVTQGGLQPGDTVLLLGTGGVSMFALDFARVAGATAIVTSSSDDKLARATERGASHSINYRTTADWARAVKNITGGRGADHVVEVGGASTFGASLQACRVGGTISMIGVLTGTSADVPTVLILHKSIRVNGIYVGSRAMFEQMNRAIVTHRLRPVIDRVFGFEEVGAALHYMESAAHFGKIAIRHE